MKTRAYSTPLAFKNALEQRLRRASTSGPSLGRKRQLLVFDRFLARIVDVFGDSVTLKGGLVMELRLERARSTKDVDLRVMGPSEQLLSSLQAAARRDLGDFMAFEVEPDERHPKIINDARHYEGLRFRAHCRIAGKIYGRPFGVDVALGDPIFGQPIPMLAPDVLGFAGIAPPILLVYPIESHIAEKLHAYTMPRSHPNSRVKDLPDIPLLASVGIIEADTLRLALEQTFSFRGTHALPACLPYPAQGWKKPYEAMAQEDQLPWETLEEVVEAAQTFLDPVLSGDGHGPWDPKLWKWDGEG